MSKMQRIYNKETLPREFKFRVNKKYLYEDDPDFVYTCRQLHNSAWCVYWTDSEKEHSKLYKENDVLDYVIDLSWIVE